jgi:hypothetical protein
VTQSNTIHHHTTPKTKDVTESLIRKLDSRKWMKHLLKVVFKDKTQQKIPGTLHIMNIPK